jgi:hypothetical protein
LGVQLERFVWQDPSARRDGSNRNDRCNHPPVNDATTTVPPTTATTPKVIVLTNPLDLKAALDAVSQTTICRAVTNQDEQDFINLYQGEERDSQNGTSPYLPPDRTTAAIAFLKARYPDDSYRCAAVHAVPKVICALTGSVTTSPDCPGN